MLRRAASPASYSLWRRAPTAACATLRGGEISSGGGKFTEREHALEERSIREHDMALLQKLREQLKLSSTEKLPKEAVDAVVEAVQEKESDEDEDEDHLEELRSLRKEMVSKIRQLEDEIAELKIKKGKK